MGGTTIVRTEPRVPENGVRPRSEEVRGQLARVLASPLFHHSRHYPSLLRYVVNETLEGRGSHLKERALGVEVFGRDPEYDTNADPVVRTSACEVRKRIAQYYHELGHENEIRIDLPAGSYVPEFRYPAARPVPVVVPVPHPDSNWRSRLQEIIRRNVLLIAIMGTVAVIGLAAAEMSIAPSAIESFWNPVWRSADSVMLAMGGNVPPSSDSSPIFRDVMHNDVVAFSDALTMARLNGVAREYGKKRLDIRRATAFTLTDLRKGPTILVGAFNNAWTMRLNGDLRFSYVWDAETHTGMIHDRQNPSNRSYIHDPSVPYAQLTQDYAVVSRFFDPLTERMVVVVGGMGRDGTIAAGEFVTTPRYLEMLAGRAPRHWERMNLQVLLATDIVKGNTGPPRILATYFW